jgi:excisionase family DNA binding protein
MTNQNRKEPERRDQELQKLLGAEEAAQALSCTVKTIHRKVRAGELGCVQISEKKRMFTAEQIENYIESKTVEPLIDRNNSVRVSSEPRKGGEKSLGFVRTDLKQEMQSWQ